MRVAIIGGGVIGLGAAVSLSRRGVAVTLFEREAPGAEASNASAGILGAQLDAEENAPLVARFVKARAQYAAWSDMLRRETGIDIGYRTSGLLQVAKSAREAEALEKEVRWQRQQGLGAELIDGARALEIEPLIAPAIAAAAYFRDEAQVDPRALVRALAACAVKRGVELRLGAEVERLRFENGACVGVDVRGEALGFDAVVIAAGAWSSRLGGAPASLAKVGPVRGQMALLEEALPRLRTIIVGGGVYAVPRGDGRVACGSTIEFVGYRRGVTAGGIGGILSGVVALAPSLADAELTATWSGLRPRGGGPGEPAPAPLVGASEAERLFVATAHYRNGILLVPDTADAIADAVTAGGARASVTPRA